MTVPLGVGAVGCGNISTAYMTYAPFFRGIEMRACADTNLELARTRATEFGLRAMDVDELLASADTSS